MRKIKKISKSIFSILLALLITVTTMPLTGIQFIYTINAQNVYQDNEKIDDSDIFYADATFVNYDSVAWTFINQCIRGTWMYIKSYRNSNMLMQPSNYDGTYTHLWDDGGAYKQWIFIPENDYFYIQNANTGKYLWFGELREGAEVNVSTPSDGRGWNNRFKLVTDQRASTFSIRPYADTNYCVEISGRDTSIPQQQDKIQIWTYYGYQNQLWNIHVDNPNLLNDTLIYNVQNNPQGTNAYNYPLSGIVPGMVQDTIDNMNLKFNNIYTAYDLFGNVDSNTKYGSLSVYQEVNTDYKFPFKIDSDGYRTFDSANMYVIKNDSYKKFELYNGGYRTWWHDVTSQYEKAIDNAFLPYNSLQNSSEMDYGFTMCMNIKFYMESDGKVHIYDENGNETEQSMIFEFTGDDDLWIYIDNDLRLDMGGIHGPKSGSINFDKSAGGGSCVAKTLYDNGAVNTESKFNLSSGVHELKIFYMERAQTDSNLKVRYNLISKNNLKIDPNGGTYRNKAEVIDLGEQLSNKKLQICTPKKLGYTFTGWDIKGTGRMSADNKYYFMGYNDTTLVAQWEPNQYNLNFDYNKPQDAVADVTNNDIITKKVSYTKKVGELPEPHLDGYTFTGWKDAEGNTYTEDTVYNVLGDTTLYAQWSRNIYTLYFDYNKPEEAAGDITGNEISSKPVTFNEMVGELPHPQLDKYTFLSWKDADGNIYTEDTVFVLSQDLTLYAFWDAAPVINAIDRYYSLNNAKNGKVTYDNLMTTASVNDDLDKSEDIDFTIIDYAERDFNTLTASAEITVTYRAVDSAGNSSMKMITVHITDTSSVVKKKNTYVRSISEKYYNSSHEDGGLEPNSIWRINSEYAAVLQDAMENKASISYNVENFRVAFMNVPYTNYKNMTCNHILSSWKFTHEDIKKVQNFIDEHGCGNFKESDALSRFIQEFSYCRQY